MTDTDWAVAVERLRAQRAAVRDASQRVETCPADQRSTAAAISYACQADYIRCASLLLRAHLAGQLRLLVLLSGQRRVWPRPLRAMWTEWVWHGRRAVWRAVPGARLLAQVEAAAPSDEPLAAVAERLKGLQASLRGHQLLPRLYEKFIPDPSRDPIASLAGGGRSSLTLPGFPDRGHWVNLNFASGDGTRIQPDRMEEANQLRNDEWAVHERALLFGDAVLHLLEHHHGAGPQDAHPQGVKARGAARWIGREQQLVHQRTPWPRKLTPAQIAATAGMSWLALTTAAIPLTVAQEARYLSDYPTLTVLAAAAVAAAGAGLIYWAGPRAMRLPGRTTAVVGIVLACAALLVGQQQRPVARHYFAGPYDRYEREYSDGCLAASPYRSDTIRSQVTGTTLLVMPTAGGQELRLGPAEDGGTQPLRPLDRATRAVLDKYGCS
jgi:hypothetical protein